MVQKGRGDSLLKLVFLVRSCLKGASVLLLCACHKWGSGSVGYSLLENVETGNTLDKCLNEVGESSLVVRRGWRMKGGLMCPLTLLMQGWEQPGRAWAVRSYKHFKQGAGFPFLCIFSSHSCVLVPSLSLSVSDLAFQTLSCQGNIGVHRTMRIRCGVPAITHPAFFPALYTLLPLFLLSYPHLPPAAGTLETSSWQIPEDKGWDSWCD